MKQVRGGNNMICLLDGKGFGTSGGRIRSLQTHAICREGAASSLSTIVSLPTRPLATATVTSYVSPCPPFQKIPLQTARFSEHKAGTAV